MIWLGNADREDAARRAAAHRPGVLANPAVATVVTRAFINGARAGRDESRKGQQQRKSAEQYVLVQRFSLYGELLNNPS